MNNPQKLDILCAETGRALVVDGMEEKALNEALAVLEGQGPYAMFLYLNARYGKAENTFKRLLQKVFKSKVDGQPDVLAMISALAENLDDLLFARDLLRNTLAYARYHYKAKTNSLEATS